MSRRALAAVVVSAAAALAQHPAPVEGRAGSNVRVLIFEDLACSDCAAFRRMLDEKLLPKYGEKVAFLHRDFPLARHVWARQAAIAARHLDGVKPDLGMEFRRETLASLDRIRTNGFRNHVAAFARKHSLEPDRILAALDDRRLASLVEKDFQDGVARGVAKTPTVFVNGKAFVETFTVEEISSAIEQALKENP